MCLGFSVLFEFSRCRPVPPFPFSSTSSFLMIPRGRVGRRPDRRRRVSSCACRANTTQKKKKKKKKNVEAGLPSTVYSLINICGCWIRWYGDALNQTEKGVESGEVRSRKKKETRRRDRTGSRGSGQGGRSDAGGGTEEKVRKNSTEENENRKQSNKTSDFQIFL